MIRATLLFVCLACIVGCDRHPQVHILTGESMGTTYRIKIVATRPPQAAGPMIRRTLDELDAALSTWRADSWVSRFNRSRSIGLQPVPEVVWPLIVKSMQLCEETDGRFDFTIGRLVQRWGFGAQPDNGPAPTDAQIQQLLNECGYQKLRIDATHRRLGKMHPKLSLDFSAIAKGYAVDRIADQLEAMGHQNYLIEFGGDLRVRGAPPHATGWRIAVPGSMKPMQLQNGALATSGPRHQSKNGLSHLIDPRSGRALPLSGPITAQAKTCMRADALATARAVQQATDPLP